MWSCAAEMAGGVGGPRPWPLMPRGRVHRDGAVTGCARRPPARRPPVPPPRTRRRCAACPRRRAAAPPRVGRAAAPLPRTAARPPARSARGGQGQRETGMEEAEGRGGGGAGRRRCPVPTARLRQRVVATAGGRGGPQAYPAPAVGGGSRRRRAAGWHTGRARLCVVEAAAVTAVAPARCGVGRPRGAEWEAVGTRGGGGTPAGPRAVWQATAKKRLFIFLHVVHTREPERRAPNTRHKVTHKRDTQHVLKNKNIKAQDARAPQ